MRRPLRYLTLSGMLLFLITALSAQDLNRRLYRTIDGTFNNLANPEWGSAQENVRLLLPQMGYADGISAPGGTDRPNPREISNRIFEQNFMIHDPLQLSDYTWVFGQFIDHDVTFTPDSEVSLDIPVPEGDIFFDPRNTGTATIAMRRNIWDPSTGNSVDNPRRHPNIITAYLDGSAVYGSEPHMAEWIRSHKDGKLKVSEGNMLPFNTVTGAFEDEVDPDAPHMENPVGIIRKQFVAGDVRANENPVLLAFHTLFVREHNRICDELKAEHPDWGDEELYQYARKIVGGIIQAIVYEEWLPTMGVELPPYTGYDPNVHAQVFNSFSAAAFRMGHTLLNANLQRVMNNGAQHPEGPVQLRRAFFNPLLVMEEDGLDPFFKGMGVQTQQNFDNHVVDDVRNFLFGPPGSPGLDLAAININRGRERGLPDFNSIRVALGLEPYQLFREIHSDQRVSGRLLGLYRDINNVDAWVGMMAEEHASGDLFGETVKAFIRFQFQVLRDGDRFYYENDPLLTDEEKEDIRNTTLHDVIIRNTNITLLQSNVFRAMPHADICDNMNVNLSGRIFTENGDPVSDVLIEVVLNDGRMESVTAGEGGFQLNSVPGCFAEKMTAAKYKQDYKNGVTTFDMVLVQKHILAQERLNSPYKILAADVDMSGSVTTLDLIRMRRVILSVVPDFGGSPSWRFIPADHVFSDPQNPFADDIVAEYEFDLLSKDTERNFIGIKLGDVNSSALTAGGPLVFGLRSNRPDLTLQVDDRSFAAGEKVAVAFRSSQDLPRLIGFQFGLGFDPEALHLIGVRGGQISGMDTNNLGILAEAGKMTTSWHDVQGRGQDVRTGDWFVLEFEARRPGQLSDYLTFDPQVMPAECYSADASMLNISVEFTNEEASMIGQFRVGQNQPNPFGDQTIIPFELPEESEVVLTVTDAQGRVIVERAARFAGGEQQFVLTDADLKQATGVFQYQIQAQDWSISRKMVRVGQ